MVGLLVTTAIVLVVRSMPAQNSAKQSPPVAGVVRPCNILPVVPRSSKERHKNGHKNGNGPAVDVASSCLEVHAAALDIQEYLQAFARDQKWKITEEHIAEDAWTFFRNLNRDELIKTTKSDANTGRVTWTLGKAFVQVSTTELDGGFTRVQVFVRFEGYGRSSDGFAPPKEAWVLDSNGTLESQFISALDTHFNNLH